MRRDEKRRRFHEAVLNTLYPPPPSPPPPQEEDQHEKPVHTLDEDFDVGLINPEDYVRSCTSSGSSDDDDEGSESQPQKLTRAQRKRLRKKKLKGDTESRRKLIGPLLPTMSTSDGNNNGGRAVAENDSPVVRQNADEESPVTCDNPKELSPGCTNQKKLKHRRLAKRVGREQLKVACSDNNNQDQD